MLVQDLPHLIAGLNAVSVAFMTAGYFFIKTGQREKHRAMMLSAAAASVLFLLVYLIYKANSGFAKFGGDGFIRPVYFTILAAHVLGAIAITPLVPMTFWRALSGQFDRHRAMARWVWPLWFYVGVSGVVIYVMAVHLYPFKG
ncbi:MAG: DUF420 domain-containing protein [Rhodospirillaceae bacterium]